MAIKELIFGAVAAVLLLELSVAFASNVPNLSGDSQAQSSAKDAGNVPVAENILGTSSDGAVLTSNSESQETVTEADDESLVENDEQYVDYEEEEIAGPLSVHEDIEADDHDLSFEDGDELLEDEDDNHGFDELSLEEVDRIADGPDSPMEDEKHTEGLTNEGPKKPESQSKDL